MVKIVKVLDDISKCQSCGLLFLFFLLQLRRVLLVTKSYFEAHKITMVKTDNANGAHNALNHRNNSCFDT